MKRKSELLGNIHKKDQLKVRAVRAYTCQLNNKWATKVIEQNNETT